MTRKLVSNDAPAKAKKVFGGVLFDVYQWPQKIYNGETIIFEKIVRRPTVDVIAITTDNKIVCLEQKQPGRPIYPCLPGGKIDPGETARETAERELIEESGYEAKKFRLIYESFGSSKIFYHEHIFVASNCIKTSRLRLDGGEKIKIRLFDFGNFLQLCRKDNFALSTKFKFLMYEALLDKKKKEQLYKRIFK